MLLHCFERLRERAAACEARVDGCGWHVRQPSRHATAAALCAAANPDLAMLMVAGGQLDAVIGYSYGSAARWRSSCGGPALHLGRFGDARATGAENATVRAADAVPTVRREGRDRHRRGAGARAG